ncbi:hypothetical protein MOQ_003639 [Trypanosoma cruzi marinkellei]|uniref:Uncharacterized protein n=1 Tax=Trypanosoma cruzi marinkellei TaxID=85056 RepID=K2NCC2_TRYCR|nr:hypothetical protein MOQ_003639 [Trypanosoma cruzi marinkellei]
MKNIPRRQQLQPIRLPAAEESPKPTNPHVVGSKEDSKFLGSTTRVTFPALTCQLMAYEKNYNSPLPEIVRERLPIVSHGDVLNASAGVQNDSSSVDRVSESSLMDMYFGASMRTTENDENEGQDAKEMQEFLVNAFPESLKHIATDEASVESLSSESVEGVTDSGYHRQFTEFVLRDVYELLSRAAAANEARLRSLIRQNMMEMEGANFKSFETAMIDESTRSLSEWNDVWYQAPNPANGVIVAVTVRPPRFVAGMLWNGNDSFLFGGTAFLQEGRILQIWLPFGSKSPENSKTLPVNSWNHVSCNTSITGGPGSSGQKFQVRLLLREFLSVSKVGMGSMMQTFSLIPENVSVKVTRNQALQYGLIQTVLDQCAPGAVSRAFSLQLLLPTNIRTGISLSCVDDAAGSSRGINQRTSDSEVDDEEAQRNKTDDSRSPSSTLTRKSPLKAKTFRRQPLGDEAYLVYTNPKLYALVMKQSPATLTANANVIREYLQYSQRLFLYQLMKRLLTAIRTIQRFFRRCIAKKERAVNRMLRLWEKLELDSRDELKKYTNASATTDRVGFIVASVLWQHVVTTNEYKLAMLEEMFSSRRAAYRKWCAQRLEEDRAKLEVIRKGGFSVGLMTDVKKNKKLRRNSNVELEKMPALRGGNVVDAALLKSHNQWILKWGDVIHARFGWYIDPEELLQEYHHRLLISLRNSILRMAEVQEELKKKSRAMVLMPL